MRHYFSILILLIAGCSKNPAKPELVWGSFGVTDGHFTVPRAAAIDPQGRLFIVDMQAKIQEFDLDGNHLGVSWHTPDYRNGRPSGLGIDRDGNVIVCDSHYHCIRIYDATGKELRVIDGNGANFGYVSDALQDEDGNFYISEFGDLDRISKLNADGNLLKHWGKTGIEDGEFNRVRAMAFGPDKLIYVADSCNHRIQVFDREGKWIRTFGTLGSEPGEFNYPFDLAFDSKGKLIVLERGNHRVQKLTAEGISIATWGVPGRQPGELNDPWALAVDSKDRIHVIDTKNHRVQRFRFAE
ncbi:6-bladed beta-propeller [Telmatocola sphagniphila]|uniref:6-bladed beta-propeller n=1 Tax=Telmatocola sphagniphila TaxID=1123043 RepID=A0A8E6B7N2_9BACT|nr:6-bladed beta-propeller [Telmatocola sphagniphila]QVL33402.1 6-bladed beta-propeller [Telmatocola sphagniphila]